MKNISVVIPTYNERKRLPKTLEEVDAYLSANFESAEIIISDGASKMALWIMSDRINRRLQSK